MQGSEAIRSPGEDENENGPAMSEAWRKFSAPPARPDHRGRYRDSGLRFADPGPLIAAELLGRPTRLVD